jgi:predicted enzyme related to lactoylglutathione lyase
MPEVNAPVPGEFCWIELATSDAIAARTFYTNLFGWQVNENDMGASGIYYIFLKNGRDVAAMYKMMADQEAHGVPPNWMSYVGVDNADEAVARAQGLGAQLLMGPFDVSDHGRMAVLKDPQGATFSLWEAKKHFGVGVRDEANTLCWNELATNDADASRSFYTSLAGWNPKVSPEYTEWHKGEKAIGGMRVIGEGEPSPPHCMPYFMVEDVDASTAKVSSTGGAVHMPPTDMEHVGRFSVVADPQGAVFALFKPA